LTGIETAVLVPVFIVQLNLSIKNQAYANRVQRRIIVYT